MRRSLSSRTATTRIGGAGDVARDEMLLWDVNPSALDLLGFADVAAPVAAAIRRDHLDCGQWPARTGCSSTRPRLPGCRSKLRRRRSPPGWRLSSGPVSPDDAAAARSGAPDVLVCARGGYVAVDVKHHRSIDAGDAVLLTSTLAVPTLTAAALVVGSELRANKDDALQLAHYRRMLQAHGWAAPTSLGGIIGKERLVV